MGPREEAHTAAGMGVWVVWAYEWGRIDRTIQYLDTWRRPSLGPKPSWGNTRMDRWNGAESLLGTHIH